MAFPSFDFPGSFESLCENLISGGQDGYCGSASTLTYFVFGVPEFIAGVLCFFLADRVARLAYRNSAS